MLTSSGQAANFYAIFNICSAGDHVVASTAIYGGTFNLFNVTMRKLGIDFTFVTPDCTEEELNAAFKENTKAVFGETIANPALNVLDIEKFAALAHSNNIPLIVDNTFATPVLCRPIEFGADIVIHSTSKYMDGHAVSLGGVIVDSGKFKWLGNDKFPEFNNADESYHGVTYAKDFGEQAFITKARAQLMRDLGSIPSPFTAFLLNLGLETLPLRIERHCSNALAVAEFIRDSGYAVEVTYPGMKGSKGYELAQKYMPDGTSGVISFRIKGGREAATKFMDSLNFISIATHVADAKSCLLHPASHTHRQLTDEQLAAAGISPGLVRLSVGIENVEDIIDDIKQAMENA